MSTANQTLSTDDIALPVVQVDDHYGLSQVCTVPSHFQLLTVDRTERLLIDSKAATAHMERDPSPRSLSKVALLPVQSINDVVILCPCFGKKVSRRSDLALQGQAKDRVCTSDVDPAPRRMSAEAALVSGQPMSEWGVGSPATWSSANNL